MYSAAAIAVMRLRAQPPASSAGMAALREIVRERAEARLALERDPAQRVTAMSEVYGDEDAPVGKAARTLMSVMGAVRDLAAPVTRTVERVTGHWRRLHEAVDRIRAEREARRLAFRLLLAGWIEYLAARLSHLRLVVARESPPPPELLDVDLLTHAPRPGPARGVAVAA